MAELVDALDSKSSSFGSVGSIPTLSTQKSQVLLGFFLILKLILIFLNSTLSVGVFYDKLLRLIPNEFKQLLKGIIELFIEDYY